MSTNDPGRADRRQVDTHPLANELVDPEKAGAVEPEGGALPPEQRRVGRLVVYAVLGLLVIAVIIAAILFRSGLLIAIATLVIVSYMVLLLAPVLLARGTKVAQDEAAGRGR